MMPSLISEQLANDPRLQEAKQLILQTVADHQQSLVSVRPPNPELTDGYQEMLDQFGKIRGGNLYFPYLGSGIGNGPFVELADGSVKLDLITGIGVHGFGHSHPMLIEAGLEAAISDTVMQGNLQQNTSSCDLTNLLVQTACRSGAALDHCFLTTSGAMANENALKMAFQRNQPANRILAFENCFAGRTLALAQLTDKASYRVGLPDTIAVDYLPFFDASNPESSIRSTIETMQSHLDRHPGQYAAVWLELVQGEGGYYEGDTEFFKAIIDLARQHQIAVIADEIQTFGRTSQPFAFQHFGLDKSIDIVTIGKITQVCATLFTDEFNPKPGLISQTFTGSTWAIIAARKILQGLIENGNFGDEGKNVKLHQYFSGQLKTISDKFPRAVQGPFGIGGMVALTPFDGSAEAAKQLVNRLYDAGLMSFMAGSEPSRVRFLMPLGCVTHEHIDLACQILEQVIEELLSADWNVSC